MPTLPATLMPSLSGQLTGPSENQAFRDRN
jgi:hypothetical protein